MCGVCVCVGIIHPQASFLKLTFSEVALHTHKAHVAVVLSKEAGSREFTVLPELAVGPEHQIGWMEGG